MAYGTTEQLVHTIKKKQSDFKDNNNSDVVVGSCGF